MNLEVGETVFYRAHGAGRIVGRERRVIGGVERETILLELGDGLSVGLTVEQAGEQLRPLMDKAGLRAVRQTLGGDEVVGSDHWRKRMKEMQAKLTGGDPLGVAEVVRDGYRRRLRTRSMPSLGEKGGYTKARRLLAGEIALLHRVDLDEADTWINEQLEATDRPGNLGS